ncbi:MAG: alpha/beta hydrolase [Ferribacterium limneticum]
MLRRLAGFLVTLILCIAASPSIAEQRTCAVVLMHGKWGNTQYISSFGDRLEPTCIYKSIELPWAKRRNYDEPYPVALKEIEAQVGKFREQGYKRVLLAGHSFGANAALAYMAEIGDADGVIALAPGHSPAFMYQKGIGKEAVDQARELVTAGKGEQSLSMDDLNQGGRQSIRMRASVLLSYFDPFGLGHMPLTASRFKKAVPFLWVVGTRDPLYPAGANYAFNKAPYHVASKYLIVEADHASTPDIAAKDVLEWIERLSD